MATEKEETIEFAPTLVDDIANNITTMSFRDTIGMLIDYSENGDVTAFKGKEIQARVYDAFVFADEMKRFAENVKALVERLALDCVTYDEDGKPVSHLYGIKVKNTGSTTKVNNAYDLICKIANDDGANVEALLRKVSISLKDLAKTSGRTEDYIKDAYPEFISVTKKKDAVVREF